MNRGNISLFVMDTMILFFSFCLLCKQGFSKKCSLSTKVSLDLEIYFHKHRISAAVQRERTRYKLSTGPFLL